MATQMSPVGSNHSSPTRKPPFPTSTPSALPIVELQSVNSSTSEPCRDVLQRLKGNIHCMAKKAKEKMQMRSVGALLPFTSRDDDDFFSYLEMHLRQDH
uniref:Uncharacterized protein n=1 Tax=Salix viminalis TaxID=40686 RepID=A0A6N2L1M6_SALVM